MDCKAQHSKDVSSLQFLPKSQQNFCKYRKYYSKIYMGKAKELEIVLAKKNNLERIRLLDFKIYYKEIKTVLLTERCDVLQGNGIEDPEMDPNK